MGRPKGSKNRPTNHSKKPKPKKTKIANLVTHKELKKIQSESLLENTLWSQMKIVGIPEAKRDKEFYPSRKWRFDFCWPSLHIAVECHGFTHTGKGHVSNAGFRIDREKINHAQTQGWRVYEFTSEMIMDGSAVHFLEFFVFKI